jgi:hypothetical protein
VESDVDVDVGTVVSSSRSPDQIVPVAEFNITDLARSLLDDSSDLHISAEEAILIANSSVNTKKYEKNKKGVEARFFDTLEKYGGNELKKLTSYANDGFRCERLFYIMLRGEKTEEKRFVLNKCLVKIALKWRNMKEKNKGEHMQPSTWETLMKYRFAVFRRKNICYNYATDFNGDGEFHAVLKSQWDAQMKQDETFASGVGTATFDWDGDLKIRECYREGKFNPFSLEISKQAYNDRLKYAIWCLGRYFLCRGRKEIAFCMWGQVRFCELSADGVTEEYVEVNHLWDKSHQCKFKNTKPRDKHEATPPVRYTTSPTITSFFITRWKKL